MRKPSEELFDLIKSLKKEELKRIKQQLNTMGKKGQVHQQLLEHLRQQKVYNEATLSQVLSINNLSAAKKRLYGLILDVCTTLQKKKNNKFMLMEELMRCKTLMDRGLAVQAKQRMYQLKQQVEEEEFLWLSPMINHELAIMESKYFRYQSFDEQSIHTFIEENITRAGHLKDLVRIWGAETQIFFLMARMPKTLVGNAKIQEALNQLSIPNLGSSASPKVQTLYYSVKGIYHYLKHELELAVEHLLQQVNLTRQYGSRGKHISAINTALMVLIAAQKYASADILLQEYETLVEDSTDLTELLRCYILRFSWCRFTFNIKIGKQYQQLFEAQKAQFDAFPFVYMAYFNMAVILFYNGEHAVAQQYMSRVVESKMILSGEQYVSLLLDIVILYEQEEWRLLDSKIKSLYRKILEQDMPLVLERYLLNSFKKLSQANEEQRQKLYLKMQEELPAIYETAQESTFASANQILDFEAWLQSKIERRPLLEILREKKPTL